VFDGHEERSRMWQNWDVNGNGILSVAEIDKRLVEKASYDPEWKNLDKFKQSIQFALKAADLNKSGFIERREFRLLLV
jgi:Ca2+-binding EF-hand superfamily protein